MNDIEISKSRRDFLTGTGTAAGAAAFAMLLGSGTAHAQEVELNAMGPTPEQMQAFMALPSGPVAMVNLLKYKEGASAEYQEYGVQVSKILKSIGAEIIFSAECKGALIGEGTNVLGGALLDFLSGDKQSETYYEEPYQEEYYYEEEEYYGEPGYEEGQEPIRRRRRVIRQGY